MKTLALFIVLSINCVRGYAAEKVGAWMTDWLVCGPFPLQVVAESDLQFEHLPGFEIDFLQSIGGESSQEMVEGAVFTYDGTAYSWRAYSAPDSIVDLDVAVATRSHVAAYAFRDFDAPEEATCLLSIGSNDGGRMWLNGRQIWDRPSPGVVIPDEDLLPVALRKGRNTLLVKIEERGNEWGFCTRLLPLAAGRQGSFFRILPQADGAAVLSFLHDEAVSALFEDAQIAIRKDDSSIVWQGVWSPAREMRLPVDCTRFASYSLSFKARLPNGQQWQEEIPFTAGKRRIHELFRDGETDYRIVLAEKASNAERWAAAELQRWLSEVSGAHFHILTEWDASHPSIIVGFHAVVEEAMGTRRQRPDSTEESFSYENIGPHILIRGGSQRGSHYGVMSFLENEMGVRWYSPSVTAVPQRRRFEFDHLHQSKAPGIRVRNDFYYEAFDPLWAARNKVNGAMTFRQQPGGLECYWSVHTFNYLLPPSEFFAEHPEYYSLVNGRRTGERAQLCLTHPEVLDIITDRLRLTMREQPEYLIYSVSQNDWGNPCECEQCQKIARDEGSEAGPVIWFVNQVAERIESEFPDKFVGTLAYTYTRRPPKSVKPRHNVVVRLCSIECCFAHDLKSCPENADFLRDLRGWAAIAPHLYIWDYVVNFSHYIMPYPNLRVLQSNIRTFRDHKAIGIMEQAAYQSRGGEFAELRAYLLAKLLWNPDDDVEAIVTDFMHGYYGRSGQHIKAYFDLLHGQVTPKTHIHLGLKPEDKLFSAAFIRQADLLFDKAEIVAESDAVRARVEMARLPLLYLKCRRSPVESRNDGTYARFCDIVEREGITHFAESGAPHAEAFHRFVREAK